MHTVIALANKKLADINPLDCGWETCQPGHSFGPSIRDYYLIHYVRRGKGTYFDGQNIHELKAGQIFIIHPGQTTVYKADMSDPWEYIWIGFNGEKAKEIKKLGKYTADYGGDEFLKILDSEIINGTREEFLTGLLFIIFSKLLENSVRPPSYTRIVSDYIAVNYMRDIKIEEIARAVGLNRRYMTKIFRNKTGMTVKEFLVKTRMEKAAKYINAGKSVSETAVLSGYADVFNFSKNFKKYYGVSPKFYNKA